MEHEDPQLRGLRGELLLDPRVAAAADLAVVEVGLGRVDGDDRDAVLAQHRVALAEEILEVDVPDVARVVVPGDDDERVAVEPVEVLPGHLVLVLEAERRQVAGADDHVRAQLVDLGDRALEQGRPRSTAHRSGGRRGGRCGTGARRRPSRRAVYGDVRAVATLGTVPEAPGNRLVPGISRLRAAAVRQRRGARVCPDPRLVRVPWEYEPRSFVLERDAEGRVTSAFTPDFYLPEQDSTSRSR